MSDATCWLAEHAVSRNGRPVPACDGRLIRAHLIPQQTIRREAGADMVWDERVWVPACGGITGCGGHHGALDVARTLTIPRAALPIGLEEFAAEFGLTWWLDRAYGRRVGRPDRGLRKPDYLAVLGVEQPQITTGGTS